MFLQSYRRLIIDRSLVCKSYPADRINTQVIYRFALDHVACTNHVLLNNCNQNITSLSLLVGTTVYNVIISLLTTNTFLNKKGVKYGYLSFAFKFENNAQKLNVRAVIPAKIEQ